RDVEEWMAWVLCNKVVDSNVLFSLMYFDDQRQKELQDLTSPILRLIAVATLGIEWTDEWLPQFLQSATFEQARWSLSKLFFRYTPFIQDCPMLWQLRLQWWIHFDTDTTYRYLRKVVQDLNTLVRAGFFHVTSTSIHRRRFPQKCVEEELQSSQLGIDHAGDFFLALFHLSAAYVQDYIYSVYHTTIPDILTGHTPSLDADDASSDVIHHLSSICGDINTDTARLIRVLIELIRANIGHRPSSRRPQNLFNLLNHAKSHLHGKELGPFSPSCQRLTLYINRSYKQFEDEWDDSRLLYGKVSRAALKDVYDDVIALLEPKGSWDGEQKDVSWPRHLLRPDFGLDDFADA
ncbi:hypothetical protein FRC17_007845, partial [Serendipita sp. 399]